MDGWSEIVCGCQRHWTFGELFADELTQAVMIADHVDINAVERLVSLISRRREQTGPDASYRADCEASDRVCIAEA